MFGGKKRLTIIVTVMIAKINHISSSKMAMLATFHENKQSMRNDRLRFNEE